MHSAQVVHLRPLELADADVLASWAFDPKFCAAAGWSVGLAHEEYQSFQARLITHPPDDLVRFGALHQGELIGYVVLQGQEPCRRELGFVIGDSRRWGQGLGRLAARAGMHHGFIDMGLDEIWAEALDANVASVRILQGLGMPEVELGEQGIYLGRPTFWRRFTLNAGSYIGA